MSAIQAYRKSADDARTWFHRNHAEVEQAFDVLAVGFEGLAECLKVGRDAEDNTHVSLAPLLWITQRQAFVALDLLAAQQAYQAWLVIRPGVEAALVMGKWMENVSHFLTWQNRADNRTKYQREFSGKGLASALLPRSDEIRRALGFINDHFAHPNSDYYLRHITVAELPDGSVEMKLHFFDTDEFNWASVLSLVHLLILLQTSIAGMFERKLVNVDVSPESFGLSAFEQMHYTAAIAAAKAGTLEHTLVHNIGLWPL